MFSDKNDFIYRPEQVKDGRMCSYGSCHLGNAHCVIGTAPAAGVLALCYAARYTERKATHNIPAVYFWRSLSLTHTHRLTHVFSSTCTMDFGVEPYNFEPEYSESERRDRETDEAIEVHEEAECRCG